MSTFHCCFRTAVQIKALWCHASINRVVISVFYFLCLCKGVTVCRITKSLFMIMVDLWLQVTHFVTKRKMLNAGNVLVSEILGRPLCQVAN